MQGRPTRGRKHVIVTGGVGDGWGKTCVREGRRFRKTGYVVPKNGPEGILFRTQVRRVFGGE